MSAAFRSSSFGSYASRTNTTILAPSGIVDGDILVLWFVEVHNVPPTATLPTGFSLLTGFPSSILDTASSLTAKVYVAYKVASGESGDYTVAHAACSTQGGMVCVSSGDTTTAPTATANTGTGTTTTALAVTASAAGSCIIFFSQAWQNYGAASPPTGTTPTFTERFDSAGITYCATGDWSGTGTTGDKTHTNPNGAADPWTGVLVKVESTPPILAVAWPPDWSKHPKYILRR